MNVRELIRLVEDKHPSKPNVVTIPGHPGDDGACRHSEIDLESSRVGEGEMRVKYAVLFEKAENNWAAYVPDLPGCMTTGKTLEETEANIREAIEGHLRTLRDFGDPIPEPTSVAKEIEISPAA